MENLLELLEKQPDKIAVADEHNSYTFRELKSLARRLGSALPAGAPIGVYVDRTARSLVLLLGVLYAGGYYIPLDPAMPAQKLQAILDDAKPAAVIDGTCLDALPAQEVPVPALSGDTPAYMIYTSGSTGKPKGVLKSHGAVLRFLEAYVKDFDLTGDIVIGNQTPFYFDASAKDYFLSLYLGATLEILPTELFSFPVRLVSYLNARKVSYLCWVPTALAIVTQLNTFREILPQYLKDVFFVGEVFPLKQLRKWQEALPGVRFVNLYGSSELAGVCCAYTVPNEPIEILPMGKPLSNCHIFLLDEQGAKITAPGVLGEVCIQSPSLALCYFHDPERTARQFVAMDGVRTFRSGDLAQYDAQGNLVFSCRSDFQIKHMGRRIELGEIEAAADTLPELRQAACVYHEGKLILFCTLFQPITSQEIKKALRLRLSDYMIPHKIKILDTMPLNANGKIDRMVLKNSL